MRERLERRVLGAAVLALACGLATSCDKKTAPDATAAGASSTAAAAPGPASSVSIAEVARAIEQSCTSICQRSQTLKCANAQQCMSNCVAMAAGTPCSDAFRVLYGCFLKEPVEHWECAEDGIAAIREGFCDKEQEQTVRCIEAKASAR